MTKRNIHGIIFECIQGDIAHQSDIQSIVNAANVELLIGIEDTYIGKGKSNISSRM